jgi:4-amino-4-deoxy-L-arabinose transferase-like glycosyltransferase
MEAEIKVDLASKKIYRMSRFAILVPVVLSAFTHLWNPAGFPDIFYDEGVYMRRVMHVLEGAGPQEGTFYDHPYFGQVFLAAFLWATGYPDSLNPSPTSQAIATLYALPRIMMGILAVLDTFLLYKIAGKRYGSRVALVSSILFAVMPITWLTRRILLDSILLPFLLSSILFAMYVGDASGRKKVALILLSGAFLGTAIFTKVPIFVMMPLVGYLVYSGSAPNRPKMLALWIIPVLLIPMIWPAYSASMGQIDFWLRDVVWQTQRQSAGFASIVATFFLFDPVLLLLGAAGFVYAAIKREIFISLWIIPFIAFMATIGYVQYFYWIPVLPVFCIAAARLIERASAIKQRLPFAIVAGLAAFGLTCTMLLVTANVTSAQFEAAAFVAKHADENTTIVSSPAYSWIFMHVFEKEHSFNDYRDLLFYPVETDKMLLVSDQHFRFNIGAGKQLQEAYDNTESIATFRGNVTNYDLWRYPYTSMSANYEGSTVEIRAN